MTTYKELYDGYYAEINNIADLLAKYVSIYRTLIDGANALNNIAFSQKRDIRKALKRAEDMGDIIDELIDALEEVDYCYIDYLQSKSGFISQNVPKKNVFSELGSGLFFAGQFNNINNMPEQYKNIFTQGLNNIKGNNNTVNTSAPNNNDNDKNNSDNSKNNNDDTDDEEYKNNEDINDDLDIEEDRYEDTEEDDYENNDDGDYEDS